MPTIVVNVRTAKPGTYTYCGRPSLFGNPFKVGRDGDRLEVIAKFIDYFIDKLAKDAYYRARVYELKNQTLGCWCHPDLCHCHVMAEFLNNYAPVH